MKNRENVPVHHEKSESFGVSQNDIDELFFARARYDHAATTEVFDKIVLEVLKHEGVKIEDWDKKSELINGGKQYMDAEEVDFSERDGKIRLNIRILNKWDGQGTSEFKKTYTFQASPEVLQKRKEEVAKKEIEREKKEQEYKERYNNALPIFKHFAEIQVGVDLSPQDWKKNDHGFYGILCEDLSPAITSWVIKQTSEEGVWHIIMKDKNGNVQDVFEVGQRKL